MALDANVRKRFHNDPAELIDFVSDEKNRDEAVRLGLLQIPEFPKPDPLVEEIKGLRSDFKGSSKKKSVDLQGQSE